MILRLYCKNRLAFVFKKMNHCNSIVSVICDCKFKQFRFKKKAANLPLYI